MLTTLFLLKITLSQRLSRLVCATANRNRNYVTAFMKPTGWKAGKQTAGRNVNLNHSSKQQRSAPNRSSFEYRMFVLWRMAMTLLWRLFFFSLRILLLLCYDFMCGCCCCCCWFWLFLSFLFCFHFVSFG